jgi:hypothetical protein
MPATITGKVPNTGCHKKKKKKELMNGFEQPVE